jgi:hypothetical protein
MSFILSSEVKKTDKKKKPHNDINNRIDIIVFSMMVDIITVHIEDSLKRQRYNQYYYRNAHEIPEMLFHPAFLIDLNSEK